MTLNIVVSISCVLLLISICTKPSGSINMSYKLAATLDEKKETIIKTIINKEDLKNKVVQEHYRRCCTGKHCAINKLILDFGQYPK